MFGLSDKDENNRRSFEQAITKAERFPFRVRKARGGRWYVTKRTPVPSNPGAATLLTTSLPSPAAALTWIRDYLRTIPYPAPLLDLVDEYPEWYREYRFGDTK